LFIYLIVNVVRQHNHHNEGKNHKHGNAAHEVKARKLASEAADEEVKS
jgi:hypothetical protein